MRLWRIVALASLLHFAQGFHTPPKRTLMLPRRASEAKSDLLEAKRDLPAPAYLLGASALWATYPSTIKCLFAAPACPALLLDAADLRRALGLRAPPGARHAPRGRRGRRAPPRPGRGATRGTGKWLGRVGAAEELLGLAAARRGAQVNG